MFFLEIRSQFYSKSSKDIQIFPAKTIKKNINNSVFNTHPHTPTHLTQISFLFYQSLIFPVVLLAAQPIEIDLARLLNPSDFLAIAIILLDLENIFNKSTCYFLNRLFAKKQAPQREPNI